jgi:MoaA/NifB/PqqE/SkfB family radical SAM enzyme
MKKLGMQGVVFSNDELAQALAGRRMLNVQLGIPCGCLNDCVYCYQASGKTGEHMSTGDIFHLIDQMRDMGARYLQILGRGEPLLNKDFLDIVAHANACGIYVNLFTCADVLGDDNLALSVHGMDGRAIVARLASCDFSVFVKYEMKNEDHITGRPGYSALRDLALERLLAAGFAACEPTRLGVTPVVTNLNIHELRGVYQWALSANIYPHLCVLISVGKTRDLNTRGLDISGEDLIELATDTIHESIRQGHEYLGPTPFPGGVRCEYLRIGLYVDDFGDVFLCSGRDTDSLGNIRTQSLADIWVNSYELRKPFLGGHGCPWKEHDGTIPADYYKEVHNRLAARAGVHPDDSNT